MGIMGYVFLLLYVAQLRNHYRIGSFFSFSFQVYSLIGRHARSLYYSLIKSISLRKT